MKPDATFPFMHEHEIKLRASRTDQRITITLPCGQQRTMITEQYRGLIRRCNKALDWLDGKDQDTKQF